MPMKSMALTDAEAKSDDFGCCPVEDARPGPRFPYGLEISLRAESMKKLGLGLMPVGTEVIITAKAIVTGNSSRERVGDEKREDMDIQITDLDVTAAQADRMTQSANRLYPKS